MIIYIKSIEEYHQKQVRKTVSAWCEVRAGFEALKKRYLVCEIFRQINVI